MSGSLTAQLTELLTSLGIPTPLSSPRELTPSLLICILEKLLARRLPLSPSERAGLFSPSSSIKARIHAVKIFLGVLQADILARDVGLSALDPGRLARGEEWETGYVGRLLCWYGRRRGLVFSEPGPGEGRSTSPSTTQTQTHTAGSSRLLLQEAGESPNTSVSTCMPEEEPERCIHQIPSPSVRCTGYLELVDEDAEIAAFEAARRPAPLSAIDPDPDGGHAQALAAAQTRRLALMRRKAELLEELAGMDDYDGETDGESISSAG